DMVELLAEGQQLEEELRQIVDYTQGGSLARFNINRTRSSGSSLRLERMQIDEQLRQITQGHRPVDRERGERGERGGGGYNADNSAGTSSSSLRGSRSYNSRGRGRRGHNYNAGYGRGREALDHKEMAAGGQDPAEAEEALEEEAEEEEEDTATALVEFTFSELSGCRKNKSSCQIVTCCPSFFFRQGPGTMRTTTPMEPWRQTQRRTRRLIQMLVSPTCLPTVGQAETIAEHSPQSAPTTTNGSNNEVSDGAGNSATQSPRSSTEKPPKVSSQRRDSNPQPVVNGLS
ncbi:hypothetical protein GOODEAATRI_021043, partial [Goodea atripinnis]